MSFSEKVKAVRTTLKLSQEDFARELGVSFATVNRWENGNYSPSRLARKAFDDFAKKIYRSKRLIMANSKESISLNMRHNKCRDTKPELLLRKELWKRGLRYRKNYSRLPGKPDIAFITKRIVVFVDGKMWHGFNWEKQKEDFKTNRGFWIPKIERNIERDIEVTKKLTKLGWKVLRFWDFEVKKDVIVCADKIEQAIATR